jgi:uncharacterized protein YndB with AHSA1/START domain
MTAAKTSAAPDLAAREIVITRLVDAPRALVWEAWTDPKQVVKWWGPNGFSTKIEVMDVRPGGVWRHTMRGPDGAEYPNESTFIEVKKPERIVYKHGGHKKGGASVSFESTWTFMERGGKTEVTIRMVFPSAEERNRVATEFGAVEGGNQTLGRLADYAVSGGDFLITRLFDAPRDLVWKAWTTKEHLHRWWGPKGFTVLSGEIDLKPDGVFLYGMRAPDGKEMWGKWVLREIKAPERLVLVSSFSDAKGGLTRHPFNPDWPRETLSVMTLAEQGGKTLLTLRWKPLDATPTEQKAFDDGYASMNGGWTGTFEQLAAYLAGVKH